MVTFLIGVGSLSSLSEDEGAVSESSGASVGPWLCMNMQFFPFLHFPFAKYLHVTCILADVEGWGALVYWDLVCSSLSCSSVSLATFLIILRALVTFCEVPVMVNFLSSTAISLVWISTVYRVLIFLILSPPIPIIFAAICLVVLKVSDFVGSLVWASPVWKVTFMFSGGG